MVERILFMLQETEESELIILKERANTEDITVIFEPCRISQYDVYVYEPV
jgi:hypothetical protein